MSVHILNIGPSTCGKSALAKELCQGARGLGRKILVCDPVGDPAWALFADWVTDCPHKLLAKAKASRGCFVVCDEAGEYCDNTRENRPLKWFARRSRHLSHLCVFIAQKMTDLAPVYRGNSRVLFQFTVDPDSAATAAKDFIDKGLLDAADERKVPQYHYLKKTRFRPIERGQTKKMPTGKKRRPRPAL